MEKKVIKFNLVGTICVLALVVAAIVGITVFAINASQNSEDDKEKYEIEEKEGINEDKE